MLDHMWLEIFAEIIDAASEHRPENSISRESAIVSKLKRLVLRCD